MLSIVRKLLARFGYVLWKKDFIVYGVLPFLDIQRLSRAWQIKVSARNSKRGSRWLTFS